MTIAIVNGSARHGNTEAAINGFVKGIDGKHKTEIIVADKLNISGCKGCGVCQCQNGCIAKDDTNATVDKLVNADMIVFATPVYWWGMTAQLKLVIDKCYCKGMLLKGKKVGLITVGAAPTGDMQYELISKQFKCIADYLNWEITFDMTFSAYGKDDLKNSSNAMEKMINIGKSI